MDTSLPSGSVARSLLRLVVMASLLAGCGDVTSLMVEVTSADLAVPADVDELRFEVRSASGRSVDQRFAIESGWPHSLAVLPSSAADGTVVVTVTGLSGGAPVVRRVVETAFVQGVQRRVEVRLERACLGVQCPEGVDCAGGMCVAAMIDGGVDGGMGATDGGLDAGVDGGSTDDAGSSDGGRDGGLDGGTEADGGIDAGVDAGREPPQLVFTEYVEGSSNNKALEIQNLASVAFDLSRCAVNRFANGTMTPTPIPLTGTVAAGGFFVICDTDIAVATSCDQLSGTLSHNGDDALSLTCDGAATPIDTFGQIGVDPGTEWMGGGISTFDHVLTRRCGAGPDPNGGDAFDPSVEWEGVEWPTTGDPAVLLAGLGDRAACP